MKCPPKGRRSAERRSRPLSRAVPTGVAASLHGSRSRTLIGRARLPAPHRGARQGFDPLAQPQARASWDQDSVSRKAFAIRHPGQRAPRGPVVVPAGRVPGAARVRDYDSRARAPRLLRFKDRLEKRPNDSRAGWLFVRENETNVKDTSQGGGSQTRPSGAALAGGATE